MNTSEHRIRRLFVAGALGAVAATLVNAFVYAVARVGFGEIVSATLLSFAVGIVVAVADVARLHATCARRKPTVATAPLIRPHLLETPFAA